MPQISKDVLSDSSRIVVKIGSSLLVDSALGLKQEWLDSLVDDLSTFHSNGCEVLLVSSGR